MNKTVTYRKLFEDAKTPVMATPGSACYDIQAYIPEGTKVAGFSSSNEPLTYESTGFIVIKPGERLLIPTGWAVKIPTDFSMRIYTRSGLALKRGLVVHNGVGIVDSDYRHPVYVIMGNDSSRWVTIFHEDRIAQLDFQKVLDKSLDSAIITTSDQEWFEDNGRTGGFGSTGVSK